MQINITIAILLFFQTIAFSFPSDDLQLKDDITTPFNTSMQFSCGKIPLLFIENRYHLDEEVAFYVKGLDKSLFFTSKGITLTLTGNDDHEVKRWCIKLDFIGSEPNVKPIGVNKQKTIINYFKGNPEAWNTGINTYSRLMYKDLWPGIDLIYSGTINKLKYKFIVKPGTDPSIIKLKYRGAPDVSINKSGELSVATPIGGFEDGKPYAFQTIDGNFKEVSMQYILLETINDCFSYSFKIGKYDINEPLILDPVMFVYCGFMGGNQSDFGNDIDIDKDGNAYVTGWTESDEGTFPSKVGPDLTYNGDKDCFVAKVMADGSGLDYCGYIGGWLDDRAWSIAVDKNGNAYITGDTRSSQLSFPVKIGPDLVFNNSSTEWDCFVAKVNSQGTNLEYCGYIGGGLYDVGYSIAVDAYGNAYVTGRTNSNQTTFPVKIGPDLTFNGAGDAFVAKVNKRGTVLDFCGYIGGDNGERGYGIEVDDECNVYVVGETKSDEFSFYVKGGPDLSQNGGYDGFLAKIKPGGKEYIYCGFIGGAKGDCCKAIAIDDNDNAYITGSTTSDESTFPVKVGPDLTYQGPESAFVAKVNSQGDEIIYCGYIGGGGSQPTWCEDIAVDNQGNAYVIGDTLSNENNFPVIEGPDLSFNGNKDAFVARLNPEGTRFDYCGYVGGASRDDGHGIAVLSNGTAFVVGMTQSDESTFPVKVGPSLKFGGYSDTFVAKISYNPSLKSDIRSISEIKGGIINYTLDADLSNANREYILFGGITGTAPGTTLPNGKTNMPINWDHFTGLINNNLNTPVFSNFMGRLDTSGTANAKLDTLGPLPPRSTGLILYFSYALNNPWNFASNPVGIEILP